MADLATLYPQSPSFNAVSFRVNTPTLTSETFSGKIRRTGYGNSFYTWQAKYPILKPTEAGIVTGYLAQTYGPAFSFEIIIPEISNSKSINQPTSTPQTSASASKGEKTVTLSNCGANTVLLGGDYIKFDNHSKVYQVVGTATADGSGNMTLYFSGSLVDDVPSGTDLIFNNVRFTAIVDSDFQQFDVGMGGMTSLTVNMREVW